MGLPGPAGPPGVPGEDGDKVHIQTFFVNYKAEPMILFSRFGFKLCCNDVCLCRGRLENTVRKVPREGKESM